MSDETFEQAAWNESRAAADPAADAAVVEDTTAAEAPDTAAAHTDTAEEVVEDPDKVEETEEVEQTDAADDAPDDAAETSADELDTQDLLDPLPSKEQIQAKWTRIPNEAKEAMSEYVEQARTYRDKMAALGGEDAIELFQPVSALLTKADPSVEDSVGAYASMFKANPLASARMVIDASSHFLRSDEPGLKDVGNAIIRDVFGEDVTVERLRGLLQLEEAGFVNLEEDLAAVQENGSNLFKKQESELTQARNEIKRLTDLVKNPEKIASASEASAEAEFTKDFEKRFTEAVNPFIERGRWTEAKELSKIVGNSILAELRSDPQYKDVLKHVKQNGSYTPENATFAVRQSMNSLITKAKARYDIAIKAVNADLKKVAGSSRNAKIKEQIDKTTKPANISLVKPPPSPFSSTYADPGDAIEQQAWKESGLRVAS